jgi:hypothetical protein
MSEFSRYLLIHEPMERALRLAALRRASGLLIPLEKMWSAVVGPTLDRLAKDLPTCFLYDFAADHGFNLMLIVDGSPRARVTAANEVGRHANFSAKQWVDEKILTKTSATKLATYLDEEKWTHHEARDRVAAEIGFPVVSWLSWEMIEKDGGVESVELFQKFPAAIRFAHGVQSKLVDPSASVDKGVEAILRREENEDKPATPKKVLGLGAAEAKSLSAAFRDAAPLAPPPKDLVAFVDLNACENARAWLDAKKRVDPAKATDEVIEQLRSVVDEGRFSNEGDRAIVVREAAAMLLAKVLRQRKIDTKKWIKNARKTKTPAAVAAWELVESLAVPKS